MIFITIVNMKVYFAFLISIWTSAIYAKSLPQSVENHYWRDFSGLVSSDAIVGGVDDNGVSTYIGQFSISELQGRNKTVIQELPATIKKGSPQAYAPYSNRVIYTNETTSNIKILSGSPSSRYKWYSTTATFPTNCRFLVTGYENKVPLHTGKATVGKEVVTGKVYSNSPYTLYVPTSNGSVGQLAQFEVLTYCQ